MESLRRIWNPGSGITVLALLLLTTTGCKFDTAGNPPPEIEACLIVGVKYPLYNPGIGSPDQPEVSGLLDQCRDRAEAINFRWTLQWTPAGSDIQEPIGVFNNIDFVTVSTESAPQCFAYAVMSNEMLLIDSNVFIDGSGQVGTLQISHSRADASWNQTCDPVQIDFCPAHITTGAPDPAPIWASHSTLDIAACEQGNAFVPLDGGDIVNDVPHP